MFTGDDETGIERSDGDRGGMLVHDVQLEPAGSVEEDAEDTDWERAFELLSLIVGGQMLSSDQLYLIAMALKQKDEVAALRFAQCVSNNRDKFTHGFMG